MTQYKVVFEVSKFAIVEAENEEEACEKVLDCEVESEEEEITVEPCAFAYEV